MTVILFDKPSPQNVQFNEVKELIAALVSLTKEGFPYAACDALIIQKDVQKKHIQNLVSQLLDDKKQFTQQLSRLQFSKGLPLIAVCELLETIQSFNPHMIMYLITLIFPDFKYDIKKIILEFQQLQSSDKYQEFKKIFEQQQIHKLLKQSPVWQYQYSCRTPSSITIPQYEIHIQSKDDKATISFPVSILIYQNALQLCDSYLIEIVQILRKAGHLIIDDQSGIMGQISCQSISPSLMNYLQQYIYTVKTVLSLELLYFENDEKMEQCSFFDNALKNEKPIVISVDERYDDNSFHLLSLALTLTTHSSFQTIQGSPVMTPVDVASITFTSHCSNRTFAFLHPELLRNAPLWWLMHSIPTRTIVKNMKMRDETFMGLSSVLDVVPETFTIPIKGQLIFLSHLQQHNNTTCHCCCKNQLCINNIPAVEQEYVEKVKPIQYLEQIHQMFIDRSIYIDLLFSGMNIVDFCFKLVYLIFLRAKHTSRILLNKSYNNCNISQLCNSLFCNSKVSIEYLDSSFNCNKFLSSANKLLIFKASHNLATNFGFWFSKQSKN